MLTTCPECHTTFRITQAQLGHAFQESRLAAGRFANHGCKQLVGLHQITRCDQLPRLIQRRRAIAALKIVRAKACDRHHAHRTAGVEMNARNAGAILLGIGRDCHGTQEWEKDRQAHRKFLQHIWRFRLCHCQAAVKYEF